MGTPFKTVRNFIRAALLDLDKDRFRYSDEVLDSQIQFAALVLNDAPYLSTSNGSSFTADLTNLQILTLSLKVAIHILSGMPDKFAYQLPVISVSRGGGGRELLLSLRGLLAEVEGGSFAISIDTDFDTLAQAFQRFYNGTTQAFSAWSGSFSE